MRLRKLTVRHFRNVGFAALEFSGRQQFLVGGNGQGKTNLLEAAGYLTALRSFRTTENKLLVGHGQHTAAIAFVVEHERMSETHVTIKLRHEGKELWCDNARVARLADHLGKFPTVVFSSPDLQLVRGPPAGRRRWLDLTLAAMDANYLRALQTFTRALAERNALLKSGPDFAKASSGRRALEDQLGAFEQTLAPAAADLIALRTVGLQALGATLRTAYGRLCDESEPAAVAYEPNFAEPSAEALLARLESGRARDVQFRTTLVGPHRDDFHFSVKHTVAQDYASEGQQRSLVLALRLAQAAWFHEKSGVRPVLLADDVLSELDPARRRRFWAAIDPASQVIATGTHLPDAELGTWQIFEVAEGMFSEKLSPAEAAS
ncbi:MAG: DNA replication and repair protein RecF [Verrucomicrobia bacterium]|nr:DNA replication and repair protein RecF [Verrucomicrobiota bacterium]